MSAYYRAFDDQQWERAREIVAEIRASGRRPRTFNVDAQEREVWADMDNEERDAEYAALRLMATRGKPAQIWEALQVFRQSFPDYDPDNLARFKPAPSAPPVVKRRTPLGEATARVLAVLPGPFAWCEIPAGSVTLITEEGWSENYIPEGESRAFNLPAFMIAGYPTTNAQFARFIAAGGYDERRWWTDMGWEAKLRGWAWNAEKLEWIVTNKAWTEPRYWRDSKWNALDHPVVGVSWYEAAAFCRWLADVTGDKIALPTEQMWQRAAQGDDGRAYPWGNDWDGARCNNSVKPFDSNFTTPVTQFEGRGDSPFGVVDLAGNVLEWCLTDYARGQQEENMTSKWRVLRGGAWHDVTSTYFRADYRNLGGPGGGGNLRGFRAARS